MRIQCAPGDGPLLRVPCAHRVPPRRGARWEEVDDTTATWTVPPERMKAKLEHRIPLSERTVAALELEEARGIADGSRLVFPSPTGRVLSDSTLSKLPAATRHRDRPARLPGWNGAIRSHPPTARSATERLSESKLLQRLEFGLLAEALPLTEASLPAE